MTSNNGLQSIVLGYDDNLGLAQNFVKEIGWQIKPYHHLEKMVKDFEQERLSCLFLPVGTLLELKKDYRIIAQATFGPTNTHSLTAVLTSAKHHILPPLSNIHFGRINPYCTTSFWALLIYLMNLTPPKSKILFTEVEGFQDLLKKTINKTVDAAMIWDNVLATHIDDTKPVFKLDKITHLPTPVIIAQPTLPISLNQQLIHYQSNDRNSYFNGFAKVDIQLVNSFLANMKLAAQYFTL